MSRRRGRVWCRARRWTCTAGYTTTQADLDAGSITNTGTVTGTPPTGPDVTAADTAVVTATQTPNIDIVKSADPETFGAAGTPISYTYLVTNNGNVTLTDVTVTDPHAGLGPITCEPAQRSSLVPGATMELHGRLHHHPGRPGRRQHHQHRHGDRDAADRADVTAADTAVVTATQTPDIDIVKSADPDRRSGRRARRSATPIWSPTTAT